MKYSSMGTLVNSPRLGILGYGGVNQLHLLPLGVCAEFSYSSVHHYRTEERAKQGIKQPRGIRVERQESIKQATRQTTTQTTQPTTSYD